jgi:hypothetical protein
MKASFGSQFGTQSEESAVFARTALGSMDATARARVVNRTHRVVRERAVVLQTRRSRVRSLMVPLILCSAFLILGAVALWSGLYQYQAAEAAGTVQADVTALAANDANNQFLVVLLWFVPVSLALMAAVWLRHSRNGAERGTPR